MKKTLLLFLAIWLPLLTSCALLPVEETPPEVSVVEESESLYTFGVVSVGDVQSILRVKAKYSPSVTEDLSFDVNSIPIAGVYVQTGDNVHSGQLLAELSTEDLSAELESAQYDLTSLNAELENLTAVYNLDIQRLDLQLSSAADETASAQVQGSIGAREAKYSQDKEILQLRIDAKKAQIAELKSDIEDRRLYAGIDGTVTRVQSVTETSVSQAGVTFVTISDSSSSLFIITGRDTEGFYEGDKVSVEVDKDAYPGSVCYVSPGTASEEARVFVTLDDNTLTFESGVAAKVIKELDERTSVLRIDESAVKTDDAGSFVYILNEDGIRAKQYIEIGLMGNDYCEIVSGLSDGDLVILK